MTQRTSTINNDCSVVLATHKCLVFVELTCQVIIQMAVLGCRSLVLAIINNQVLHKIKIVARILSRKGRI